MSDPLRAKIVTKPRRDGSVEILTHCPQTGRDIATGLKVKKGEVEKTVKELKQNLERAGNRVEVREM